MKKYINNIFKVALVISLAAFVFISGTPTASALFYVGKSLGFGTIVDSSTYVTDGSVTYSEAHLKDNSGRMQSIRAFSFNPLMGECIPLVYSKYTGYGSSTYDNATSAEERGYDVKGAVNGAFFGLTGASANIYGGVCISDGKIMQGSDSYEKTWVLAINSDGSAALAESKISYSLDLNDGDLNVSVECINICHTQPYGVIYYFDEMCGNKTDVYGKGIEVVFEKQDGGELCVGETLVGRVAEVRKSVSSGGDIGKGQFVLYTPEGSPFYEALDSLEVGDTARINPEETVEKSKDIMENCSSAVVTYGYHIVKDGVNVTASDGLPESQNTSRGQRTALGIKEDGTMIFLTCDGRSDEYQGLTVYELADALISMGCTTAVNFDGGGSSQLVVEDASGELVSKTSQQRRVSNSILIVKRPAVDDDVSQAHEKALHKARLLLEGYELTGEISQLTEEINEAQAIRDSSYTTGADYIRSIKRLHECMKRVEKVGYHCGIYALTDDVLLLSGVFEEAEELASISKGTTLTVTEICGAYGYTRYRELYGWIDLTRADYIGSAVKTAPEISAPEVLYPTEDFNVSWTVPAGASGYTYKLIELYSAPAWSDNESENARLLMSGSSTGDLSITLPYEELTGGGYLKLGVCAEYPDGCVWSVAYIGVSGSPFYDIPIEHWGYSSVVYCYENGVFNGVSATEFAPTFTMNRAMMAMVLYHLSGSPATENGAISSFADVKQGAWYYDAVLWCEKQGLVNGINKGTFDPDGPLTREQAVTLLMRYARYCGADVSVRDVNVAKSFVDYGKISAYANDAVAWAVENGLMQGHDNRLDPTGCAERIHIAALTERFMKSMTRT